VEQPFVTKIKRRQITFQNQQPSWELFKHYISHAAEEFQRENNAHWTSEQSTPDLKDVKIW